MAFSSSEKNEIEKLMDDFLKRRRPPEDMRDKLDLSYRIKNQSIEIFELRPQFIRPEKIMEDPVAKITFVRKQNVWKVYWMMSDLKWHSFEHQPQTDTLAGALQIIDEDETGAFWG